MSVAANYDERVSEQTFRLDAGKVGMMAFLCSEVAFFSSLFVGVHRLPGRQRQRGRRRPRRSTSGRAS